MDWRLKFLAAVSYNDACRLERIRWCVALALSEAGVLALPYIVLRNDHMDSLATGLAVSEFAPDSIAAAEIRALWAWSNKNSQLISAHSVAQV